MTPEFTSQASSEAQELGKSPVIKTEQMLKPFPLSN